VDATDYKGRTAAVIAASRLRVEHLFALLRDCRASVSGGYFWEDGFNIFHHLAILGESDTIREVGRILSNRGDTSTDIKRWVDETCRIPKCKSASVSPAQLALLRMVPELERKCDLKLQESKLIQCVKALVDLGSTVLDSKIADVMTLRQPPLHYMCEIGNLRAVVGLVHIGAPVNQPIEDNITPLYIACTKGHTAIAAVLLAAGADPDAAVETKSQNGEPCTAREFAKLCQFPGIKALFE
jgi:hypothetical protein